MRLTLGLYSLSVVGWTVLNKDVLNRPNRFFTTRRQKKFCKIDTWGQCYKTFSVRDLQIVVLC
jgi:hypothetical protein